MATLQALASDKLRKLHRGSTHSREEVHDLLDQARRLGVELRNGVDHKSRPRTARVVEVNGESLTVQASNIAAEGRPQIYFQFDIGSTRYFFASPPIGSEPGGRLRLASPAAIYEAERRDLPRHRIPDGEPPRRVLLASERGGPVEGTIRDWSYQGLGVRVPRAAAVVEGDRSQVEFLDARGRTQQLYAQVRRREVDPGEPGWLRLGLEVSAVAPAEPFPVERRERILEEGRLQRAWKRVALAGAMATESSPFGRSK